MNPNHFNKSGIGGELGEELNRLWKAVRENRIVSSPGLRVDRKPSGTSIHLAQAAAQAAASEGGTGTTDPLTPMEWAFSADPSLGNASPRESPVGNSAQAFTYLTMRFTPTTGLLGQQFLLPPIENVGFFPSAPSSSWFTFDGKHFPLNLYNGTWGWRFTYALVKGTVYETAGFTSGKKPWSMFPANPNGNGTIAGNTFFYDQDISGYLDPNQLAFHPLAWMYFPQP